MENQINKKKRIEYTDRRIFSTEYDKQTEELKNDSLMQEFADSRRKLQADPLRPIYHFTGPKGGLNDPNGLCYWNGNWHMFYQFIDDDTVYWGHTISPDLYHWQDLPYAIYPGPETKCFSGATYVEENRVIAMYFGVNIGSMIATSEDPLLLNWTKIKEAPVIPNRCEDGAPLPYHVFDNYIWKEDDTYYALSGKFEPHPLNKRRLRQEYLFKSKDLKSWEYLHTFIENDYFAGIDNDGACPYFLPIADKHMLLHFSHKSGPRYLVGKYDREMMKFIPSYGDDLGNGGSCWFGGIHAPSAYPDGKGNVIAMFNVNHGMVTFGCNQVMSLPRRMYLGSSTGDELFFDVAEGVESLRKEHVHIGETKLSANKEIVLDAVNGNAIEILAQFDNDNIPCIEMKVLRSPDDEEYTKICFFRQRGNVYYDVFNAQNNFTYRKANESVLTVDSTHASLSASASTRPPESASVYLPPDEKLNLRIFIDKSIIEVFINGKQGIAQRVYPTRSDSTGVSIRATGKDIVMNSLDVWQMKSIYEN